MALDNEKRTAVIQELRDAYFAANNYIVSLETWIRDVANDTCLCVYHAGVCPSCRAKAFLKENL